MKKRIFAKITIMIFALIVFSMAAFSMAAFSTVLAADASASVTSGAEVARGQEITFTVAINNEADVQAIMVVPAYDTSTFDLVSGSWTLTGALMSDFSVDTGDGVIAFSSGMSINGSVLNFKLKAKDSAAIGNQTVSAEVIITTPSGVSTLTTSGTTVKINCNHSFTGNALTYIKSEASCTSPAIYYNTCIHCGEKGTTTFENGAKKDHSFTKQVTTDAYKLSGASCTAKAVYYYCCATCDAKGTTTFEYGSKLDHSFTKQVITDDYKVSSADCENKAVYNYCCATCDAKGTTTFEHGTNLGHTGGSATCTSKAICSRCSAAYGSMLDHVYTEETTTDFYLKSPASCTSKAIYYKNCATCDKAGTTTFEYGNKKDHTNVEKAESKYLKAPATCTSKAVFYKSCSVCGAFSTETFEYGAAPSHTYSSSWSADSSAHWHECSKCGDKKDSAAHTAGPAATESTAQTCTVCQYIIAPALNHTHNFSSAWSSNASEHWHDCSGCIEKKDTAPHTFDNDCDTECNTCGYTRVTTHTYKPEWLSDSEKHWHECSACGAKTDEATHVVGASATETTDQVCTVCAYVIEKALGHTHRFNEIWSKNSNEHWHECECGEKTDVAPHNWDGGAITKEATELENGIKTYTCTDCSEVKTESIAKLSAQKAAEEKGSSMIWIIIIAASVVAAGGIITIIIVKKKH